MLRKRRMIKSRILKEGGIFVLVTSIASYAFVSLLGIVSISKIIDDKYSALATLTLNLLLGGFLYALLNICHLNLPLNIFSASCITVLGVPGVILLVILKFLILI